MKFPEIRNQEIAADRIAGTNVKLSEPKSLTVKQLIFAAADQVHCRFNML